MTTGPENPYGQNPYDPDRQQPPPPAYPPQPPQVPPQVPYGQPVPQPYPQVPYGQVPYGYGVTAPNDGLATAAMIVGIVSLVLMCGYGVGLLGSPVALVMGRISMKRIDASGGTLGGRGMAQTGFILGIIGTVLLVLAIIAVVVIVIVAVNGGFDSDYSYDTTSNV